MASVKSANEIALEAKVAEQESYIAKLILIARGRSILLAEAKTETDELKAKLEQTKDELDATADDLEAIEDELVQTQDENGHLKAIIAMYEAKMGPLPTEQSEFDEDGDEEANVQPVLYDVKEQCRKFTLSASAAEFTSAPASAPIVKTVETPFEQLDWADVPIGVQ